MEHHVQVEIDGRALGEAIRRNLKEVETRLKDERRRKLAALPVRWRLVYWVGFNLQSLGGLLYFRGGRMARRALREKLWW